MRRHGSHHGSVDVSELTHLQHAPNFGEVSCFFAAGLRLVAPPLRTATLYAPQRHAWAAPFVGVELLARRWAEACCLLDRPDRSMASPAKFTPTGKGRATRSCALRPRSLRARELDPVRPA